MAFTTGEWQSWFCMFLRLTLPSMCALSANNRRCPCRGQFSQLVTKEPASLPTDVLKEIDSITIADLQAWTKNLWSKGFGQALIQGNIDKQGALNMAKSVEDAFKLAQLPEQFCLLSARGLAASCSVRSPIL